MSNEYNNGSGEANQSTDNKINCRMCVHFYVTWEPKTPYGCRGMGFKTVQMPSAVVRKMSGSSCQLFKHKFY